MHVHVICGDMTNLKYLHITPTRVKIQAEVFMIKKSFATSLGLLLLFGTCMAQSDQSRAIAAARALTASKAALDLGVARSNLAHRLARCETEKSNPDSLEVHALNFETETLGDWPNMTEENPDEQISYKPICNTVPSADCHVTMQVQCEQNTLPQACTSAPGCTMNVTSVADCTQSQKQCDYLTLPPACNGVTSVKDCTKAAAFCNYLTLPSACSTSESACFTKGGNCDTQGHFCKTITVQQSAQCTSQQAVCQATFNQQNSCAITKNLNCINTKAAECATSASGCVKTYGYACTQTFSLKCLTYKGDASICKNNIPMPVEADPTGGSGPLSLVLMVGITAALACCGLGKEA
jgi:hypothetical protein